MLNDFRGSVLLFAVERETAAFLRLCSTVSRCSSTRWVVDGSVLVETMGVGKPAATAAVERLLADGCLPRLVIVAGFAGALREGLQVGEVVVASRVVDEAGACWTTSWPDQRHGCVLTCNRMIGDPAEKRSLGEHCQADIVEMESAAVAEACRMHGLPFGCVRVVSDDIHKPLSQRLMSLVESGRVKIGRVLWEVLRSPPLGVELIRLARQTKRAARNLAGSLHALLG